MVTVKEVVQECMDEYAELNSLLSSEVVDEIINDYDTKNKVSHNSDVRKSFKNNIAYDIHDKVFNTVNENFKNLKSYSDTDDIIVNINLVTEYALRPIYKKYKVGTKYIGMVAELVIDERLASYEHIHLYENRSMAKLNVKTLKSYLEDIRKADIDCCKSFKSEVKAYN
ncbi:MAG: hypothetical protein L3J10_05140 [Sulfurimonas sp.]|nr:hypothetical protein [Sulfurimonas sp.]